VTGSGDASFPKFFGAFPPDNAVIAPIDQPDRQLFFADDGCDDSQPWPESPHGCPSGIELLPYPIVVDILNGEFIYAGIDQSQRIAYPQQEEEPSRSPHRCAEQDIAGTCLCGQPVPGIQPKAIRRHQDQFVDQLWAVLQELQGYSPAHAVAQEPPAGKIWRDGRIGLERHDSRVAGRGLRGGQRSLDTPQNKEKVAGVEKQSFIPFGLTVERQVDSYKRKIIADGLPQEGKGSRRFAITMKGEYQPGTSTPAAVMNPGISQRVVAGLHERKIHR